MRHPRTRPATIQNAPGSPWRTLGNRSIYRNPWLSVTEYDVIRPDGERGIYGVVDPGVSVTIVALEHDETIWLIRELSYPLQRTRWILPSGRVESGESPIQAAQRELAEEVVLHATAWKHLGAFLLSGGISTQISHIYLAQSLQHGMATPEATERGSSRARCHCASHMKLASQAR